MSRARFAVTYEIVTPESAERGDADERGYVWETATLRDAIQDVRRTRTAQCDGVESVETDRDPCIVGRVRAVTITNGAEFRTGASESRTLHIPDSVTLATSRRIARLLGVRS